MIRARSREIEVLADAQLEPELVVERSDARRDVAEQPVGVDEREVADEDRRALAETPCLPTVAAVAVRRREPGMHRRGATADGRPVHHVVVHEREGVQQLDRSRDVGDPLVVGIAPGADEPPEAERRAETLATVRDEVTQGNERRVELGRDLVPPRELKGEQVVDALLDPRADLGEPRGERDDRARRAGLHGGEPRGEPSGASERTDR